MIYIRNTQKKTKIDIRMLKRCAKIILQKLGYNDFDLSIWLSTNRTIQTYNNKYRKKNRPTDILSFPFFPNVKAGITIKTENEEERNLGDIIISIPFVQQNIKQLGVSLEYQLKVLLVHGICHLLGYDHIEDKDYEIMKKKEKILLKLIAQ